MRILRVFLLFSVLPALQAQSMKPLTQVDACKLVDRVVRIDTDVMHGTGVIVGSNGWIITAMHVVADQQTLAPYGHINVTIGDSNKPIPAEIKSTLDQITATRDFAILKIHRSDLPHIEIEDHILEFPLGSPIAVIGLPISANFGNRGTAIPKFCLSGTIAAQEAFPLQRLRYARRIYFQGVSIKGISGAPIILLESGKVIGIVSTKLTGISVGLDNARQQLVGARSQGQVLFMGTDLGGTLSSIIETLDNQLANGLGGGTEAYEISEALKKAEAEDKRDNR